jgi:ATP-dependent Clp protease ATP-binding subunit ClpC
MELFLLTVTAFAIGALVGFYLRSGGATPAAPPDPPSSEPHDADTAGAHATEPDAPVLRVIKRAEEIAQDVGRRARPQDILDIAALREAAAWLSDAAVDLDDVRGLATGSNDVASYIAYAALHDRDDGGKVVTELLPQARHCSAWSLYFLLRFIAKHADAPVVGRVLLQTHEWWLNDPNFARVLGAFAEQRIAAGERPAFGDALEAAPPEQTQTTQAMLRQLRPPVRQPLEAELDRWQRTRIDEPFLRGIGHFFGKSDYSEWRPRTKRVRHYVDNLIAASRAERPKSVLIVGQPGSGPRYVALGYLEWLERRGVRIVETSGQSIIAGQKYIGEIEQRVKDLVEKTNADRGLALFVPRFHELANLGAHEHKPEVLLDYLLPAIESRTLQVVGIATPHAYQRLLQRWPGVNVWLELAQVTPAGEGEALEEVTAQLTELNAAGNIEDATRLAKEVLQIVKQYSSSDQLPGSATSLVKASIDDLPEGRTVLTRADLLGTLSRVTGLPREILDEQHALDLGALRKTFAANVIGQDEAVDCLVERIAMIKAGLSDPSKPAAVLMFAGPTGSGKTELAKTLARLLFGSEERMLRIDMSELADRDAAEMLTGVPTPNRDRHSLVTRIREQPFSVILLDEFEKAHPQIWDLFLQVFDDGRLSDTQGNVADFRHSIIILTSNLGATINPSAGLGFVGSAGQFDSQDVLHAIGRTFRREFVNRLDRVLVFKPLSRESMRKILHLQLTAALQRRGFRNRAWAVEWEDTAVNFLLDKGFTPDLGARPLRRAIERYFLAPLAANIVESRFPKGDQFLFVRARGGQLEVEFVDPDRESSAADETPEVAKGTTVSSILMSPSGARSEHDFLSARLNTLLDRLTHDNWTGRKTRLLAACNAAEFWEQPSRYDTLAEIELMDRMEAAAETAERIARRLRSVPTSRELIRTLAQKLYLLGFAYRDVTERRPYESFLGIKVLAPAGAPGDGYLQALTDMYTAWAEKRGMRTDSLASNAFETLLAISGFGAYSILAGEDGLHIFEDDDRRITLRVSVVPQPRAPEHDARRFLELAEKAVANRQTSEVVRRYQLGASPVVRDLRSSWRTGKLQRVLGGDFDLFGTAEPLEAPGR